MKLLNFTIIKLTLCLIIGILVGFYFPISVSSSIVISASLVLSTAIVYLILRSKVTTSIGFGILSFATMISFGVLIENLHDQKHFSTHYSKQIIDTNHHENLALLRIKERLKPNLYYSKYVANVLKLEDADVSGKVLLTIPRDSTNFNLKVNDVIFVPIKFTEVNTALNPHQFDYRAYLQRQYIYHQVLVGSDVVHQVESSRISAFGFAGKLRDKINTKLKQCDFELDELAIINALLLGQRQDMDKAVYQDFINAGVVHVLAVSGLHIGIILLILNKLLNPIRRIEHGAIIKTLTLLALLWSYAVIAGLSASITRAVTMFSIVAIAMNMKRPTNIYNTLAISMFFILLFKPLFLFEVGFQLSYTAVIAIVTIQPMLYNLWHAKWKVTDYLWQIFSVTLAAQIGVAPISIFYFHQFPGLFFVANMAIIPFLPLILGLGLLVIVLGLLDGLPDLLVDFYGAVISLMNSIVKWVSEQEQFLLEHISLSLYQMLSIYLFLLTTVLWLNKPRYKHLAIAIGSILLIQASFVLQKYEHQREELTVFHKSRYSLIGKKSNTHLTVFHNLDSLYFKEESTIKDYSIGNFIDSLASAPIKSVYSFKKKKMLVVDSLGVYNIKSFKPDYVLLRNSPKINLHRLLDSLKPKKIIADGSNYKSYVKQWKLTCDTRGVSFHNTRRDGAFVLK